MSKLYRRLPLVFAYCFCYAVAWGQTTEEQPAEAEKEAVKSEKPADTDKESNEPKSDEAATEPAPGAETPASSDKNAATKEAKD